MMRYGLLGVLFVLGTTAPLSAQGTPADSAAPRMRQRIETRFRQVMREQLGLSEDLSNRVLAIEARYVDRRRGIALMHQDVSGMLAAQLRPGVAADPAVVTRALDSLGTLQVTQARLFAEEQRELAPILTPVQRAQLYQLRARINARVEDVMQDRRDRAMGRRGMARRP
jgi:hypothetical protein